MTFRIGLKALTGFSRQLGTMLEAGLPIRRALSVIERGAPAGRKALFKRLGERLEDGRTFSESLEHEGRHFPLLFCRIVRTGEAVGGLDQVLKRLADYYEFIRNMWARLLMRLLYPLFQYWALIFVLAGVAYLTAMLAGHEQEGMHKALRILGIGVLIFITPIIGYFVATRLFGGLRAVHEVMIRIPALGIVMRTLALARFSWSMELMTGAGVNIFQAITWSLQATANGAFEGRAEAINQRLKDGISLSKSLEMSGLFPYDYIEMVNVSEESGSMPEMFGRLARNYFEKADTAIRALTSAISALIWICVAAVIIYYIFQMAGQYLQALNGFSGE